MVLVIAFTPFEKKKKREFPKLLMTIILESINNKTKVN